MEAECWSKRSRDLKTAMWRGTRGDGDKDGAVKARHMMH